MVSFFFSDQKETTLSLFVWHDCIGSFLSLLISRLKKYILWSSFLLAFHFLPFGLTNKKEIIKENVFIKSCNRFF